MNVVVINVVEREACNVPGCIIYIRPSDVKRISVRIYLYTYRVCLYTVVGNALPYQNVYGNAGDTLNKPYATLNVTH
jgi:hypothetical protein